MVTEDLLFLTSTPQALNVGMRLRVGQVIGCVGGGSTGYVYRVQDEMGGLIAVREYFPGAVAMRADGMVRPQPGSEAAFLDGQKLFDEDGWQLAAQDHPGLVKVHQVWSERGTSYLAMPWCEGHTLGQIVRASPMPPSQAQLCIWLRAIGDALSLIHRRRGLHGNLSLEQVMVLGSGRLLLMEFARARRAVARDPRDIERDPFAALECGTDPRCGPMGPWTDVYAVAAMLHFILRGRAPQSPVHRAAFDAQEPLSQIKALSVAGYSQEFLHGIDRGLALRARARPQSLPEFLALLGLRERRSRQRAIGESLLINLPVSDAARPAEKDVTPVAETAPAEIVTEATIAFHGEVMHAVIDTVMDAVIDAVRAPTTEAVAIEPDTVAEAAPHTARLQPEMPPEFDHGRSSSWPTTAVPTLTELIEDEDEAAAVLSVPPSMPRGASRGASHHARPQRARMSATLVMAWVAGLGAIAAFAGAWLAQANLGPEALSKVQVPMPAPLQNREAARTARADAASQALPWRADGAQGAREARGSSFPIPDPMEPTAAGPMPPGPADRTEPGFAAVPVPAAVLSEPPNAASEAPHAEASERPKAAPVEATPSAKRAAHPPAANAQPGARNDGALVPAQPSAEAQAPATRAIEEATDASPLSRRCPELLARQYTGPPLQAAERELLRMQCR